MYIKKMLKKHLTFSHKNGIINLGNPITLYLYNVYLFKVSQTRTKWYF